jgi:hypothetical protein
MLSKRKNANILKTKRTQNILQVNPSFGMTIVPQFDINPSYIVAGAQIFYLQALVFLEFVVHSFHSRPLTWISNMATVSFEVRRLKLGLQWPSQSIQFPSECLLCERWDYLFVAKRSRLGHFLHHILMALYLSLSLSNSWSGVSLTFAFQTVYWNSQYK